MEYIKKRRRAGAMTLAVSHRFDRLQHNIVALWKFRFVRLDLLRVVCLFGANLVDWRVESRYRPWQCIEIIRFIFLRLEYVIFSLSLWKTTANLVQVGQDFG